MSTAYATLPEMNMPFGGAKLALIVGNAVITILRDDKPDIPFPAHWDLPGGGREGCETPLACVLRETREELGVAMDPYTITWGRPFAGTSAVNWFFAAQVSERITQTIRFGNEGQGWRLMPVTTFLAHPKAVPNYKTRLRVYLNAD